MGWFTTGTVPVVLQAEASECGLACLTMVAGFHGDSVDLVDLRRRFLPGSRGVTGVDLVAQAHAMGLAARAVRLELAELSRLQCPAILHWDMNHFVVLVAVRGRSLVIHDPAVGRRKLSLAEIGAHFTGVALELNPGANFSPKPPQPGLSLQMLSGPIHGLKRSMAQIFCMALCLEVFAIAAPLLNQVIIDDVITTGNLDTLTVLVLGFGLLLLTQTAIATGRSLMTLNLGQSLSMQWRGNVFKHLVSLPVHYFERRQLGDILSRFSSVSAIQQTVTGSVIEAVLDGLMTVGTLAMMFWYSPALTAVVIVSVLLYALLRLLAYRGLLDLSTERVRRSALESSFFLESLRSMMPLKLFCKEEERLARWRNLAMDVTNADTATAKLNVYFNSAKALLFGLENLIVLWLAAHFIMQVSVGSDAIFTVGMLFAFMSYKGQFANRSALLVDRLMSIKLLNLHYARLADIVLEPPERGRDAPAQMQDLEATLEFKNVSFRYGATEPWILKNVSITIPAGAFVAFVGPSGGGKTTLLKLLLGILEPTAGEVLFGGIPLRQLGMKQLRQALGVVMQEDALLSGSLADNITFFDVKPDHAWMIQCAAMAQMDEDIRRMPMGYQTLVGDLGHGLSGGQKQRVLLARALYKRPLVLALDEATSHLDLRTERAVSEAISSWLQTRIIIAHRPQTIEAADSVLLVAGGRVTPRAPARQLAEEEVPKEALEPGGGA